ncbi:hypothetical protein A2160_03685 [Candidatus Beckwithbacteria bacterium RBG_13_42_9]|uniref:GH18 domain-containing protein n=1 Tax=Candidatus Beckwithbacteria bacterium RBG_13_42_9 TaxID=1797457 RepID=A0A1F5E8W1_9BACT|nr:MAG: hypothetical protein A2160_03685 [Candidatus Beckwithbacteria bacterium RBG_13_42_9]
MKKKTIFAIILFSVLTLILLSTLKFSYFQKPKNTYSTQNQNALWLRYQWVGEAHKKEEYEKLAQDLKQNKITDAFFHVGPLNDQGNIEPEKYPFAQDLIGNLKPYYPELKIQAWIGQVEKRGGGILDISDLEVRNNIVATSEKLLNLGFDGVHYNIEPIYSGDANILDLTRKTKAITQAKSKTLSIASDEMEIFPGADKLIRPFVKQAGFWSKEYYREVADNVDQIAVMMYDTGLPFRGMFSNIVAWETRSILVNLKDKEVTVFMGVPTYEDKRWSFHPEAENMESGILGVQKGLEDFNKSDLERFGIAIYAEWTTDKKEWQFYRSHWLQISRD